MNAPIFTSEELQDVTNSTPSRSLADDLREALDRRSHKVITEIQLECQEQCDRLYEDQDYWIEKMERRYPELSEEQLALGVDKMQYLRAKELHQEAWGHIRLIQEEMYFVGELLNEFLLS